MGRLTDFEHNVVGDIGEEVNRAHTAVIETNLHCHGADIHGDVLHFEAGVSVNEILPADCDFGFVRTVIIERGEVKGL